IFSEGLAYRPQIPHKRERSPFRRRRSDGKLKQEHVCVATLGLNPTEKEAVEAFRRDVVEPSMTSLVILDFWAEWRSEEHTSELQSLMRISYAVFCLKKK